MTTRIRREHLLLVGIIVAVTLIALPTITYPLGRDQGEFATIGRGILDGKIPYVDLWNPKPPAVFYVYALAIRIFGRTAEAIRVIDLFLYPPLAITLYWIGRRIAGVRVGLWAALLFGVFYFTETFWTLAQNDGIALLPMALAVACALKAADGARRSVWWAFGAGALTAAAIWFKYPFALLIGVVAFAYGWAKYITPSPHASRASPPRFQGRARTQSTSIEVSEHPPIVIPTSQRAARRSWWRDALAFALGGLVIGGGGVAYMLAIGAWDALLESARLTASYTLLGISEVGAALQTALGFRIQLWGALFVLALIGLVLALRRFNRKSAWWIAVVWLIGGAAMMSVQLKFYDYHFLPMLPPLVLIAAGALEAVIGAITRANESFVRQNLVPRPPQPINPAERGIQAYQQRVDQVAALVRRLDSGLRASIVLILFGALLAVVGSRTLPYLTGQEDQAAYYHHFVAGEFVADESLRVADFLRARVAPGDSLFIWGFRPEVYYLSQLNPAVRFIFQFPLVADWYPPEWRDQTAEILWAALPPYVLVLQVDYMPWVTGSDDDSNTLLQGYTELNNWLEFNYERETQIGNFLIWRRTSASK